MSNNATQAQVAGLRRLSARANTVATATQYSGSLHRGLDSFAGFAERLIEQLRKKGVDISKGLSEAEFLRIEATFSFTFPPDLRAVLKVGVPVGAGFPDWRSGGVQQLRIRLHLPCAGLAYEASKGNFWYRNWGQKPENPDQAVEIARAGLKKAPLLVPVFGHCYLPSAPDRAGNPLFFVYRTDILCCGVDLEDFFNSESFTDRALKRNGSVGLHRRKITDLSGSFSEWPRRSVSVSEKSVKVPQPRWIEFWSDLAERNARSNSNSNSSPKLCPEITWKSDGGGLWNSSLTVQFLPRWLEEYLEEMAGILRRGGWKEQDIAEMMELELQFSAPGYTDGDDGILLDGHSVLEGLILKADILSTTLRNGGWSSHDIADVFEIDFPARKPVKKISPDLAERIGKLAESVAQA